MTDARRQVRDPHGWRKEGRDLMKAIAGGSIVGLPLLYTMEVWQHGILLVEWHLLALLGAILVLNFLFCLFAGFREEYSVGTAINESVTAVAVGVVFAAVVLWMIGEIHREVSLTRILGKIVIEAAAVSVGVSFVNIQIRGRSRSGEDGEGDGGGEPGPPNPVHAEAPDDLSSLQLRADLQDAAAALAGATVFALNIAPTEEVILIATRLVPLHLLALLGFTFLLCYVILFASGFEEHRVHVPSLFQNPWAETAMTCAISLVVAALLLLLLGQREEMSHVSSAVAATVALGLPATVGGAAGRLIL